MRRGLKRESSGCDRYAAMRFKPIPDEEGTETTHRARRCTSMRQRFKPIPDEEGTETRSHGYAQR